MHIVSKQLLYLAVAVVLAFCSPASLSQTQGNLAPVSLQEAGFEVFGNAHVYALSSAQQQKRNEISGKHVPGEALHAGFSLEANLDPAIAGEWFVSGDTLHVWRIKLNSPGAFGTGVNFAGFELEKSARLFVYDKEQDKVLGPFDSTYNNPNQVLATAVLPGETIIVEYQEPYHPGKLPEPAHGQFEIESLVHLSAGERFFASKSLPGFGNSGNCNVNVNCPEGDDWQDEKRGIARMFMRSGNSYFLCSGSLINNTAEDATPYFLSAQHCGRNASAEDMLYWQFYFNYERPGCENQGMPPYNMVYGAVLVALGPLLDGSDFRLLLLQNPPPDHWRPYWNGWDRSNDGSDAGTGIHHPSGDVKKISHYTSPLTNSSPLIGGQQMAPNSAWRLQWSPTESGHGVTEGGSSGSPVFNSDKKIIGTLTGGAASCANPFAYDFYGKMWYHWDKNDADPSGRLDLYLDPLGTGVTSLPGFDPYTEEQPPPGFISAHLAEAGVAEVSWYPPGLAPNEEGWYAYTSTYSHLTWSGPERATVFDPPALGLNYPLHLQKIAHTFMEHDNHPWPDNRFRFRIYDNDGESLIYESALLTAQSMQEYVYELEETLQFNDYFYVAIVTEHPDGFPSSLMQSVNLGAGFSFFRSHSESPWSVHNDGTDNAFAYLFSIFVDDGTQATTQALQAQSFEHGQTPVTDLPGTIKNAQVSFGRQAEPDAYHLYRDNNLIYSGGAQETTYYPDDLPTEGIVRYFATAVYAGQESAPSENAYLLYKEPCAVSIDSFPYEEIFDAAFDDSCWFKHNMADGSWELTTMHETDDGVLLPVAGEKFFVFSNDDTQEQDAWLVMPDVDFSQISDPALRFAFNRYPHHDSDTASFSILISHNNRSFEKVWDSSYYTDFFEEGEVADWQHAAINLERYGNQEDVYIAFQVQGTLAGFCAIDHLEIVSAADISYDLTIAAEPSYAGTVRGAGTYLAGEAVRLTAFPNVAYEFHTWMHGSVEIGHRKNLFFVMPDTHTDITARFNSIITSTEEYVDPEANTFMTAYPNPAKDMVFLLSDRSLPGASIRLHNFYGQLIREKHFSNIYAAQEIKFALDGLSPGIYFIQISSKSANQSIKLIINQ